MFKYWQAMLGKIVLRLSNSKSAIVSGRLSELQSNAHGPLLLTVAAILIVLTVGIYALDVNKTLFLWLQGLGRYIPESLWASITLLGDALTVIALLLLFARKYPNIVWAGVLAALFTTLLVQSLKHSLVLPRPPLIIPREQLMLIGPEYRHASFPSGHSTAIWVFVSVWLFSVCNRSITLVLLIGASLVSLSRVMVGAHWPVDITTGALIGWVGGWAGVQVTQRWRWGMTLTGQRIIVAILLVDAAALFGFDAGYAQAGYLVDSIAVTCLLFGGYHFYVLLRHPQRFTPYGVKRDH